jgi:hypothetical protein
MPPNTNSTDSAKVNGPLTPPDNLYRKDPLPPLTPREKESYKDVFEYFSKAGYRLPGVSEGSGELTDDEKFWLSYECILRSINYSPLRSLPTDGLPIFHTRFLRGTRWKHFEAIQRLENTLKWRREFGLYSHLTTDRVEQEVQPLFTASFHMHVSNGSDFEQARHGTQVILGYDTQGRPAFYMVPDKQSWNSTSESRHLQFTVFMLERCIELMPPGVEYAPSSA